MISTYFHVFRWIFPLVVSMSHRLICLMWDLELTNIIYIYNIYSGFSFEGLVYPPKIKTISIYFPGLATGNCFLFLQVFEDLVKVKRMVVFAGD